MLYQSMIDIDITELINLLYVGKLSGSNLASGGC